MSKEHLENEEMNNAAAAAKASASTENGAADAAPDAPNMQGYTVVDVDDKLRQLFDEIFNDDFMKANTNFDNFEGFKYSSAVIVNWTTDQMIYADYLMDGFVRESTRFQSWDEMVKTAADERFAIPGKDK